MSSFSQDTGGGSISIEAILAIIQAGIQAPSGDNAQPWKFTHNGKTIQLFLDREADHSFFNVHQLASIISCGAVLENMRIAASEYGLHGTVTLLPDHSEPDLMGVLELSPDNTAAPDPLVSVISQRHTNRRSYTKQPLPHKLPEILTQSITSRFPGAHLHWVTEQAPLRNLAHLIYQVDRIRSENRELHLYLCKMIRWTDEEVRTKQNGLPLKNLEAGVAGELFLKLTRPWGIMSFFNSLGFGKVIAQHSYKGIMESSGAALLTVDGNSIKDFLMGGQAMEHAWLLLTQQGLMVQPMAAITLFGMRWQLEGEKDFSEKHQKMLHPVWEEYRRLFPEVDFERHGQVMLFRCGFGKPIRQHTLRKDARQLLTGSS